jgi:hypothetical protein
MCAFGFASMPLLRKNLKKDLDRRNGFCDLCFFCKEENLPSLLKLYQGSEHRLGWQILSEALRKQSGQCSDWKICGIIKENE